MNIGQIKRKIRFTINRITGKSDAINEYNLLMAILVKAADEADTKDPMKEYIYERLSIICKGPVIYSGSTRYAEAYNPFIGSKSTTRKKIALLRETMIMVDRARTR